MLEGEATQEPTAPDGASASPADEDLALGSTPSSEIETEAATETGDAAPFAKAASSSDWSHLCGFQTISTASEAMARPEYAEELAKEFSARAARFALSVDESIVLSNDGLIRWLGDPLARAVAGDGLLQPRAVLLADDALAGEDRAAVETRTALWLSAHVRKVLGPLLALGEGADLPEAARTIGGAIVEALGVLERDRVREGVRSLDQTARGALRKLGVRFGSLYIYVPALLKPAPRGLCTLLWTLKRGSETGADRLLAFASAGRTSFANEGLLSPDAYRVAGFRLCGERVVRVDIIERLSDLVRAAIPDRMRAGGRPSLPTSGFAITPQMTSLTGCSGEAFASILRSLGFESAKVSKAAFDAARATAPTEPLKPVVEETTPASSAEPEAADPGSDGEAGSETEPAVASHVEEAPAAEASEPEPEAEAAFEGTQASEAVAPEPTPEDVVSAPVDEEIEIWRPSPRRPRATRPQRGPEREPKAPAHALPQDCAVDAPAEAVEARAPRRDETSRRGEGKPDRHEDRRPQKAAGPRREPRPVQIDPDSPFAKLAALKPLLERRDKRP